MVAIPRIGRLASPFLAQRLSPTDGVCDRSKSTRGMVAVARIWGRHTVATLGAAAAITRSAGIARRRPAKSVGRFSGWLATSNGAGMGRSWSRCRMRESGCGWFRSSGRPN